jgi:hypothetical protein
LRVPIPEPLPRPSFVRGDCNADGEVRGLVTDAVFLLTFNFLRGPPPGAPFPDCGAGTPADDELGCETAPANCAVSG